jgi:hypothetical protein
VKWKKLAARSVTPPARSSCPSVGLDGDGPRFRRSRGRCQKDPFSDPRRRMARLAKLIVQSRDAKGNTGHPAGRYLSVRIATNLFTSASARDVRPHRPAHQGRDARTQGDGHGLHRSHAWLRPGQAQITAALRGFSPPKPQAYSPRSRTSSVAKRSTWPENRSGDPACRAAEPPANTTRRRLRCEEFSEKYQELSAKCKRGGGECGVILRTSLFISPQPFRMAASHLSSSLAPGA